MRIFHEPHSEPLRSCDHAQCRGDGLYRAPKSRDNLRDYHWFCLEHVREYNRSWNYCAGMNETQIEDEIRRSTTWERPTWRPGAPYTMEQRLRQSVYDQGGFHGHSSRTEPPKPRKMTREMKALAVLGLNSRTEFDFYAIKSRYRELVKRHHPDANGGDPAAEERLKVINEAFRTLKTAYAEKAA